MCIWDLLISRARNLQALEILELFWWSLEFGISKYILATFSSWFYNVCFIPFGLSFKLLFIQGVYCEILQAQYLELIFSTGFYTFSTGDFGGHIFPPVFLPLPLVPIACCFLLVHHIKTIPLTWGPYTQEHSCWSSW